METTGSSKFASPRLQRRLLLLSALVLAAGVATVLIVFLRNTGTSVQAPFSNQPVQKVTTEKKVPLSKEARGVAGRFILTAVLRRHMAEAWKITGPGIKAGISYKQWLKGDIPVVPYTYKLAQAPLSVKESTKDHALLLVALLTDSTKIRPYFFFMDLVRVGKGSAAHWLVNGWVPAYGGPGIPANPAQ